jgi:hypothetical protein
MLSSICFKAVNLLLCKKNLENNQVSQQATKTSINCREEDTALLALVRQVKVREALVQGLRGPPELMQLSQELPKTLMSTTKLKCLMESLKHMRMN